MEKIKNTPQVRQTRLSNLYLPTSRHKIKHTVFSHIFFVHDITFLMIMGIKCPSIVFLHINNCLLQTVGVSKELLVVLCSGHKSTLM